MVRACSMSARIPTGSIGIAIARTGLGPRPDARMSAASGSDSEPLFEEDYDVEDTIKTFVGGLRKQQRQRAVEYKREIAKAKWRAKMPPLANSLRMAEECMRARSKATADEASCAGGEGGEGGKGGGAGAVRAADEKAVARQQCFQFNRMGKMSMRNLGDSVATTPAEELKLIQAAKKANLAKAREALQRKESERKVMRWLEEHSSLRTRPDWRHQYALAVQLLCDEPPYLGRLTPDATRMRFHDASVNAQLKDCGAFWNRDERCWCAKTAADAAELVDSGLWLPQGVGNVRVDQLVALARCVHRVQTTGVAGEVSAVEPDDAGESMAGDAASAPVATTSDDSGSEAMAVVDDETACSFDERIDEDVLTQMLADAFEANGLDPKRARDAQRKSGLDIPDDTDEEIERLRKAGLHPLSAVVFDTCSCLGPHAGVSNARRLLRGLHLNVVHASYLHRQLVALARGKTTHVKMLHEVNVEHDARIYGARYQPKTPYVVPPLYNAPVAP